MALEREILGPEFLASLKAKTALETPQIVLSWTFASLESPFFVGVPWRWANLDIRRSEHKHPENKTEGTSVVSEAYSEDPSTGATDLTVEKLREYFYSVFFTYKDIATATVDTDQNISRIGTRFSGVARDARRPLVSGISGTSVATAVFTDSTGTFLQDGVSAGNILVIANGGADDGSYVIDSVDSDTQITLTSALTLTASNINYTIRSHHDKFWVSGVNTSGVPSVWLYNTHTEAVDYYYDLSDILAVGERVQGIAFSGEISSTRYLSIVTQNRYIRIVDDNTSTKPGSSKVNLNWNLSNQMTSGFRIAGGVLDSGTVYVLDSSNQEIVRITESTGVKTGTNFDLSGLGLSDLRGVTFDSDGSNVLFGSGNSIVQFDASATTVSTSDVDFIITVKDEIQSDFSLYQDEISSNYRICIANDVSNRFQEYRREQNEYRWQQTYIPDKNTVALFHLNETTGAIVDSGPNSTNGINSGLTQGATGYFGTGYQATAASQFANLNAIGTNMSGAEGSITFWAKATTATSLSSGTSVLFDARVNANNRITVSISSGSLLFEYVAGGTTDSVSAVHPSVDTDFHAYTITWSSTDDEMKAFVDGEQFGTTQTGLGTFAGTIATASIGSSGSTMLGTYDEVHVSAVARNVASVESVTSRSEAWAYSGRSYTETNDNVRLDFHWRDNLFTERFMGGPFLIRNDYEVQTLHPPNKALDSSEVIFRGPTPLPDLGHLGRTTRLFGLIADRQADNREAILDYTEPTKVRKEDMPSRAAGFGLPGFNNDWNIDRKRIFFRVMPNIVESGGTGKSYENYARLWDFIAARFPLTARRRLDSVIESTKDSSVQPIYFDEMGSFDTRDEDFPLAVLRLGFFKQTSSGSTGATSVPADRLFTDSSASFSETCRVGNIIKIKSGSDAGEYYVSEVHSDTEVKVDRDWPVGSLSNQVYENGWELPATDPDSAFMLNQFRNIAPSSMKMVHLEVKSFKELPGAPAPGTAISPTIGSYVDRTSQIATTPVMSIPRFLSFASGSSNVVPTIFARANGSGGLISEYGETWSEAGTGTSPTGATLGNGDRATVYTSGQMRHEAQTIPFAEPGTLDYFACVGLVLPTSLTAGVGRYFGSKLQCYNVSTNGFAVLSGTTSVISQGSISSQQGQRCILSIAGNRDGSQRFYLNNTVLDTDDISSIAAAITHTARFSIGGLSGSSTANTFSLVFMGLWQPADIGTHDQAALVASIVSSWDL